MPENLKVSHFEELAWEHPAIPANLPEDLVAVAQQIQRKGLAAGEGGFFASHVRNPPGHVADPHSHDHSELMVVLEGSMTVAQGGETTTLSRYDSVVIPAGTVYGFEVGEQGVSFLLVRAGKAVATIAGRSA